MNYLTTTQLRTQTSKLVETLKKKGTISLIHRSKIIGEIKPVEHSTVAITDIDKFKRLLNAVRPKKLIPRAKREEVYRKHLEKKYGRGISGR